MLTQAVKRMTVARANLLCWAFGAHKLPQRPGDRDLFFGGGGGGGDFACGEGKVCKSYLIHFKSYTNLPIYKKLNSS